MLRALCTFSVSCRIIVDGHEHFNYPSRLVTFQQILFSLRLNFARIARQLDLNSREMIVIF